MRIRQCRGYELEKAQPNTSEDFFNRSEVTFVDDGDEKTLHVLYVRYFDQLFPSFTPYEQDPIFQVQGRDVYFKDIVALVCLLSNPSFRHRKRIYISEEKEFRSYFEQIEYAKLPEIFSALEIKREYELTSPLRFIKQPL
ncbi:hypothetical protein [Anoxybacteroides tepidamans]|uniref:hypothetical protein n=1 Tax=Anoxybacteroides tepidamans TaxID=265948 RepID=UPI000481EF19|nr:hypothetical protein [Anoxybacillus tepidamans]